MGASGRMHCDIQVEDAERARGRECGAYGGNEVAVRICEEAVRVELVVLLGDGRPWSEWSWREGSSLDPGCSRQ